LMQGFNQRNQNAQQGMMAVVDHFTKQAERRKEEKSLAKSMDAFYKTESGGKVLKDMGIPLHDYLSMSDGDRLAIGKAGHESVALKGLQQKFEQGAAEFLAKQKMDDLQLAAQKQETEGNTAFDLAQAAASRPGTLEIPNTTLPGIFPDRTVGTRSQPTLQEAAQQILQTPGAARSRAGIQLLEAAARERGQQMGEGAPFYNRRDVGNLLPVQGAPGYGIAVTGPRQSQVIYTGAPQGGSVAVPGVGDVGVITTKPGQAMIVPGQQTQGQIREALAKAEADIAKLRTKMQADPEMKQYLGGALAEQESLANSYRAALGTSGGQKSEGRGAPAPGTVMGGYRFKGGNPNDKANWEAVN